MVAVRAEQEKHSPPGSRAGPRRQAEQEHIQMLLQQEEIMLKAKEAGMSLEEYRKQMLGETKYDFHDMLLDDLIGNTADLTSTPTPEPEYLADQHETLAKKLAAQMGAYHDAIKAQAGTENGDELDLSQLLDISSVGGSLPSDKKISKVIRAYRDKKGKRRKPVGVVKALKHILHELGVPVYALGDYSYHALMSCCASAAEARRIMKLMNENGYIPSEYTWSILVDIVARDGDFQGCKAVMEEMVQEGISPTQAAYTSLMAACHKICNDSRLPRPIRSKAWDVGWNAWKDMRIIGIEADAMAYGAIIRLCAARGQAERAVSLLEEMKNPAFDVKPTTLCFASALQAVARSHAGSIRFESGASKRDMLREKTASHHGKMARSIVLMAEEAEVDQNDDAYISALMQCAAVAGDSATAKAILLASEVRKLTHLRYIGSDEHLERIRLAGEKKRTGKKQLALEPGMDGMELLESGELIDNNESISQEELTLTDGEYSSVDVEHVGELAEIADEYSDMVDPSSASNSLQSTAQQSYGMREYGTDTRVLSTLLRSCAVAVDPNGIGTLWEGSMNQGYLCIDSLRLLEERRKPMHRDPSIPGMSSTELGISALEEFDEDKRERHNNPHIRKKYRGMFIPPDAMLNKDDMDEEYTRMFKDELPELSLNEDGERNHLGMLPDEYAFAFPAKARAERLQAENEEAERKAKEEAVKKAQEEADDMYFDYTSMKWKSRKEEAAKAAAEAAETETDNEIEGEHIMEAEMTKWKFDDSAEVDSLSNDDEGALTTNDSEGMSDEDRRVVDLLGSYNIKSDNADDMFTSLMGQTEQSSVTGTQVIEDGEVVPEDDDTDTETSLIEMMKGMGASDEEIAEFAGMIESVNEQRSLATVEESSIVNAAPLSDDEIRKQNALADLREILPGMPESRLERVYQEFEHNLSTPSMISLVPLLRETMPDYVTNAYLKRLNNLTVEYVMARASEAGLVDEHMLNNTLQFKTASGNLDKAVQFYEDAFAGHNIKPSQYTNRLMMQMFIKNKRLTRALAFKSRVEEEQGQVLDLPSYGSLIDHYGRTDQLGSAMMLLRECVSVHGSAPNNAYLRKLRVLCQKQGQKKLIENLAGEDPRAWIAEGLRNKKDRSYKTRRASQLNSMTLSI